MTKGLAAQWHRTVSTGTVPVVPSKPVQVRATAIPRVAELAQITSALHAGRSLLVVGDVGTGKTHLIDSFASSDSFFEAAPERTFTHRAGTAGPGAPVWISVGASRDRAGTPLGALLDVLPDVHVDVTAPIGAVRSAVLAALRSMGAGRALVVRVEDAHLLDDLSARVLAGLARQDDIQLVATVQTYAVGRSPWFELWKDSVADRITLGPFTRDQVEVWLRGSLGGVFAADALRQVWRACAGNPFHLEEVARSAVGCGTLHQAGDVWVWSGRPPLSSKAIELVQHEIAHVGPEGRRALDLVAVARGLDRDVLERIVPAPVIDELLADGLLTVRYQDSRRSAHEDRAIASDHGARLPHLECTPLFAQVLVETASSGQRREIITTLRAVRGDLATQTGLTLVTSVAAALECGLQESPDRILRALHFGLMAAECYDVEQIATRALAVLPDGAQARLGVRLARAQAWRFLDQPARALLDIGWLAEELAEIEVDDEAYTRYLVEAAEITMAVEQHHHGDSDAALRALAVTERQLVARLGSPLPAETSLRIAVARLVALGCAGRFHECRDEALTLLSGPGRSSPNILPLVPLAIVDLVETGRMLQAQALVQHQLGVAVAHSSTHPWSVAEILSAGFLGVIGLGDVEAAEGAVAMLSADEGAFTVDPTSGHLARSGLASMHGRWSDGRVELRSANVQFAMSDVIGLAAMTLVSEALMAIASGDTVAGRELLARADAAPRRMYGAYMDAEIRCLRLNANTWLRAPDLYDQAVDLAEWAAARGLARVELDAVHLAVFALHGDGRLSADDELLERAHEVAVRVDGRRAQAMLAHVVAMYSRDQDLIMVASRELGECGVWLPLSQPSIALTRREQEIAGLAAGGLSSKEIADRLFLSVRTVDSHLSRIFAKAGVRSRRELAAVLHA